MLIARQKKKENIAEYLLYMWQIEDILRAYKLDINLIQQHIIDKFDQPGDIKEEIRIWYKGLIEMMREEQLTQHGHLQVNQNILIQLTDLHLRLLKSPQQPFYISAYYKTLPFIVELRSKAGENQKGEIETCFSALYGLLLLKLQKKTVSEETQKAVQQISYFLAILAEKYKAEAEGTLEI